MESPPEYAAQHRDRKAVLGGERFGDDVAGSGYPGAHPRNDQSAQQSDEAAHEERVRLSMHRSRVVEHVVAGLYGEDVLGKRVGGHRELARRDGFEEQAGTEVEWSRWHGAPPIYWLALIVGAG